MAPRNVARFSSACVVVALLAACSGDDAVPSVEMGVDAGRDASAVCTMPADCRTAMYCDGVEACAPGAAGADARGCVAGTAPCASGETCVEATDSCRACSVDDADGDGVSECDSDCDDADATRYPGATELCDYSGHDEDCDLTTYGTKDDDGDGFSDARCCNGLACGLDCDDTRGGVHPGVPEVCNGRDDDCNGVVDDGDVLVSGYADLDRDLYGAGPPIRACPGSGLSVNATDCNDVPPAGDRASPAFEEVADDGIDNDCDGLIDETGGPSALWYRDADGDGFGDASDTQTSTTVLLGYVLLSGDCDDTNATRSPIAAEQCNGIDDNCNGLLDYVIAINDWEDDDGDGYVDAACGGAANDCDDRERATHPSAPELCDGRDNDCGGVVDELCDMPRDGGVPVDGGGAGCTAGASCATDNACERGATDCSSGSPVCVAVGPSAAGTTCRVSASVCDLPEACDGVSVLCPGDGFVAAGTTCRGVAGICDVSETCTGGAAACPADGFTAAGTACRGAADVCDAAETCIGSSTDCPGDGKQASGTACRAAAGACDIQEACDGVSDACPVDAFLDAGTACRAAADVCDVAETCDGGAAACPADGLAAAGAGCRADVGECDVAEACDGLLPSCPVDAFEPVGSPCMGGSCVGGGGCVSGCEDGVAEQTYGSDMHGCDGAGTQCVAASLCAVGWHLCSYEEYAARGGASIEPTAARWLSACVRNGSVGTCPSAVPCSVCDYLGETTRTGSDWTCDGTLADDTGNPYTGVVTRPATATFPGAHRVGCATAACTWAGNYGAFGVAGAVCCL